MGLVGSVWSGTARMKHHHADGGRRYIQSTNMHSRWFITVGIQQTLNPKNMEMHRFFTWNTEPLWSHQILSMTICFEGRDNTFNYTLWWSNLRKSVDFWYLSIEKPILKKKTPSIDVFERIFFRLRFALVHRNISKQQHVSVVFNDFQIKKFYIQLYSAIFRYIQLYSGIWNLR